MTGDVFGGLQVIDLSSGIAGPIAGQFLADFGAEVVKVERGAGDAARKQPGFRTWNRNKMGLHVEDGESDARWLRRLARGADVLIVNDAANLDPFGLTVDALTRDNPALVVLKMPVYVGDAPWIGQAESHGLLAASVGVARRQSSWDGGPVESVNPILLYVHGAWGAACAVAALVERKESGFGQVVSVSGVQAAMVANIAAMSVDPAADDPPTALGVGGRHPTYRLFEAADNSWFASGALGTKFETAFLEVIELSDLLDDPRVAGNVGNLWQPGNVRWVSERIAAAMKERTRDEWVARLAARGIPCAPVSDRNAWLDHEQMRAIGMRLEVADPGVGETVMPGIPIVLSQNPGRVLRSSPALGEHNGHVTARQPQRVPDVKAPIRPGPLAGFRVLDLGTFVAGPYAGSLLAELGADVIKVEPPQGDPFRATGFTFNRGMRSVAVDLQDADGVEFFYRLAATSDVVLDAFRPGVTERLKIDYKTLQTLRPDIITISLSAYGHAGPMQRRAGVDMVLQALSGMMSAQGGGDSPVANTIAIIDVTAATLLALGTTLALFHRARTGEGQQAFTSLAAASAFLQSGELTRYRNSPQPAVGGRDFRGPSTWNQYYAVTDGWIRVHSDEGDKAAETLATSHARLDLQRYSAEPSLELGAMFSMLTVAEAVDLMTQVGVAACEGRPISKVIRDPKFMVNEILHVRSSAGGGFFVTTGRPVTFSRTPRFGPLLSPGSGQHTLELGLDLGLDEDAVRALCVTGAIAVGAEMPQKLPPAYR